MPPNIPRANSADDLQEYHEFVFWKPPPSKGEIIAEGILKPCTNTVIFGDPKAWKTGMTFYTAMSIATGTPWFGFKTTQAACLLYQVELPKPIYHERVLIFDNGLDRRPPRNHIFYKSSVGIDLDTLHGLSSMAVDIDRTQKRMDADHLVVFLDPIYLMMKGHVSDPRDMKLLFEHINDLKYRYNVSFVIIHHKRLAKHTVFGDKVDEGGQEAMGSSYFLNWCDTMIRIDLTNPMSRGGDADEVKVSWELSRHARRPLPGFKLRWSRTNLYPKVIQRDFELPEMRYEPPSVRGLDE